MITCWVRTRRCSPVGRVDGFLLDLAGMDKLFLRETHQFYPASACRAIGQRKSPAACNADKISIACTGYQMLQEDCQSLSCVLIWAGRVLESGEVPNGALKHALCLCPSSKFEEFGGGWVGVNKWRVKAITILWTLIRISLWPPCLSGDISGKHKESSAHHPTLTDRPNSRGIAREHGI